MTKSPSPDLSLPLSQPITLTSGPRSHLVTLMDAAILIRDMEPFRQSMAGMGPRRKNDPDRGHDTKGRRCGRGMRQLIVALGHENWWKPSAYSQTAQNRNVEMAKAKSKATVMVADGAGGLVKVEDRRIETEWPIQFEVPKGDQADTWLRYLNDECHRRDWSSSSFGQFEPRENSGSITVNEGRGQSLSAISWERKRGGLIKVRARPARLEIAEAGNFLTEVNDRCRSQVKECAYCRRRAIGTGKPAPAEVRVRESQRSPPLVKNVSLGVGVTSFVQTMSP